MIKLTIPSENVCEKHCEGTAYRIELKRAQSEIEQLEARVKELEDRCIKAFMAGQIDCRVDPSYSSAKAWFETEES